LARIFPFAALRYDAEKTGGLASVVTQPYDKITPRMLERYQALSPHNLSFIIKTADYAAAARRLEEWTGKRILVPDSRPAIYPYFQSYPAPGRAQILTRRGFIAAGQLEDYDAGVVFRHEQTLSGPKQDRLALLRATRVHFGQIFMLYSDPSGGVEELLDRVSRGVPRECVGDEYGVEHRVWRVDQAEQIALFQRAMLDKKLVIADGHHRYETALAFREECRAAGHRAAGASSAAVGGRRRGLPARACEAVMMTLVNADAPGLTILPTHRILRGFPGFERVRFLDSASRFFEPAAMPVEQGRDALARCASGHAIGAALRAGPAVEFLLLRLKSDADLQRLLPGFSPAQRRLDVVVLHELLLKQCLGIGEEAVREEKFLEYAREFEAGIEAVEAGASACFFLNPPRIGQVLEIALAGGVLPQKSTDFYPKLLSGLAGYRVCWSVV
jgi:uncharacterized protein (DUF1015 family)